MEDVGGAVRVTGGAEGLVEDVGGAARVTGGAEGLVEGVGDEVRVTGGGFGRVDDVGMDRLGGAEGAEGEVCPYVEGGADGLRPLVWEDRAGGALRGEDTVGPGGGAAGRGASEVAGGG